VSSASTIAPFGASIGLPFEAEWSPLFAGTSPRGLDALGYRRVDVSGVPEALSELSLHPVVGCFGRAIASV